MTERKKKYTIYTWMDWWLVETFFLLWISDMTMELGLVLINRTSIYHIFRWLPWQSHIMGFIGIAFLVGFLLQVNEENEKRAFILALIILIFKNIAGFTQIDRLITILDLSGFVMAITAYYYIRKAGQYRRLNCIKSPFGTKGKKALVLNVTFFVSIAFALGAVIYLISPVVRLIR